MCTKNCNNSAIGFSKITNNSFNRFHQSMDYIKNCRSTIETKKAAKHKITKFLSINLNVCPQIITEMALDSLKKLNKYKAM